MIKMTQKNYEAIKIYNLKEKIFTLKGEIQSLKEENAQLKELLKECKCLFNRATVDGAEPNNAELIMILTQIEQTLGENNAD